MDRIWRATLNTWNGLKAVTRSERAFQQELGLLALAIPLALLLTPDTIRRLALLGTIVAVIVVELLNTAIEKLADRVTLDRDPSIGIVKDIGSAAVGVALVFAGAVWAWIAAERFWP